MTDAEVTAYLAGREVASLDAQSVASAVGSGCFGVAGTGWVSPMLCARCKHGRDTAVCPCGCEWPLCVKCAEALYRNGYGRIKFHGPGNAA